jgi:hypothetical protein
MIREEIQNPDVGFFAQAEARLRNCVLTTIYFLLGDLFMPNRQRLITIVFMTSFLCHTFGLSIKGQCTVIAPPVTGGDNDPIRSLAVRVVTSDSLFSGTERDVWIDIGPKAWKLEGTFPRGSTRTVPLPVNNVAANSGLTPGEVPIFWNDVKFVRLEKKGISLADLPPLTPELIALQPIGRSIGGITNAPDDLLDLTMLGGPTPQNMLQDSRAKLAATRLALDQQEAALVLLRNSLTESNQSLQQKILLFNEAVTKVIQLQSEATQAANQLSTVQNRLADVGFKFVSNTICTSRNVVVGLCVLNPLNCLTAVTTCRVVRTDVVTDAWNILNNTLPGLQQRATNKAIDLNAALLVKQTTESNRLAAEAVVAALQLQIDFAVTLTAAARTAVQVSQVAFDELDNFIRNILPNISLPDIPKPGQWEPRNLVLIINGRDYVRCEINQRLKRGRPSWVGVWSSVSPEQQFINGLRVNINSDSSGLDRYASALTTYFKVSDISGWESAPVEKAKIVGVLKHEPSEGADGFVSLDLQIESIEVNGTTYILDDNHGIRHIRFIRVEYLHRHFFRDDKRYKQWNAGQRFQIAGQLKRDTDRVTFYEIHPKKAKNILLLN